jgi:5-methylcytosine-specific restriction protein A
MAFSDSVVQDAWKRAGGECERCGKQLTWENNCREGRGCWEAHHKTSVAAGGSDTLSNCEILCFDCHAKTRTFGG